jgi:cystathionine beta-lyase/cystathionine gamma-synthase
VVFIETPSNPDMKVPDLAQVVQMVQSYQAASKRQVVLLVDTTFAPPSQVLQKVHKLAPTLNALVFCSTSKAISRGKTTGGVFVFSQCEAAGKLRDGILSVQQMFDSAARPDQIAILAENHRGVEERCDAAYRNAVVVGDALVGDVKAATGKEMTLQFVTPLTAKEGFTTPTFSFNLPSLDGAAPGVNEGLAQRFVDLITAHPKWFKPCVSFGQDNSLIYCTVPATSTQGAIKEEDKAKQALGGVQLVRLSFPPTLDIEAAQRVISDAISSIYVMKA